MLQKKDLLLKRTKTEQSLYSTIQRLFKELYRIKNSIDRIAIHFDTVIKVILETKALFNSKRVIFFISDLCLTEGIMSKSVWMECPFQTKTYATVNGGVTPVVFM